MNSRDFLCCAQMQLATVANIIFVPLTENRRRYEKIDLELFSLENSICRLIRFDISK